MLVDGLTLTDTSDITNPIVASGTTFPPGSTGELFYRTDSNSLYVYNGSGWIPAANGIGFADLNIKPACVVGTTANITLGGFQTIDGYTVVAADRVLVKNQSTGSQNGIYVVSGGSWARADDFDGVPAVLPGDFVFVTRGTAQADTGWVLTTDGVIQIGVTALTFAQFTGASSFNGGTISAAVTITSAAPQLTLGVAGSVAGQITGAAGGTIGSAVLLQGGAGTATPGAATLQGGTASGVTAGGTTYVLGGAVTTGNSIGGPVFVTGAAGSGNATGGAVTITSGAGGATGVAGNVSIACGTTSFTGGGAGNITITGGSSASGTTGGNVTITAGNGSGTNSFGGDLRLFGSVGTGTGTGGSIIYSTGATALVERLRILATGAWSVGTGGTAYGTSGQVLTSNGNAAPTWQAAGGFSGGTVSGSTTFTSAAPQITLGVAGSVAGQITGANNAGGIGSSITITAGTTSSGIGASASFFGGQSSNNTGGLVTLQGGLGSTGGGAVMRGGVGNVGSGGAITIVGGAATTPGSGAAGGAVSITGGAGTDGPGATVTITAASGANASGSYSRAGGDLTLAAGNASAAGAIITNANGGQASLAAGNGVGTGSTGGNLVLSSGTGTAGGAIVYRTGTIGTGILERFRILDTGAWSVGTGGTAYGTSGQVLTSNGNAAPTWSAAPGFSGGTITGATTFTSAAPQITLGTASIPGQITQAAVTGAGVAAQLLTFQGGAANGGTGGAVLIKGGSASATGGYPAGALTVTGGDANGGQGGDVIVSGGANISLGSGTRGGNLSLNAGLGGIAAGGYMSISTAVTNTLVERLRILANGAWSVGTGGVAYGTSGQVLTSNGNAAPTWAAVSVTPTLTSTQIGFGSAGNALIGSTKFTWNDSVNVLYLADTTAGQSATIQVANAASGAGNALTVQAGNTNGANSAGGLLTLKGGNANGTAIGGGVTITSGAGNTAGGDITFQCGSGANTTTVGGNIKISAGVGGSLAAGGYIALSTATNTTLTERLRVLNNGAWSVGSTGTAYGTSGQVLTSNGNAAPTWAAIPATIASALANTTTIGDGTVNAVLQGPQGTGTSGNVVIKSGITSSGVGGIVQIYGMQSTAAAGQGGSISLAGGAGGSTSGAGGAVNLQAGNSYGATTGADVSIIGGVQAGTGVAGNVILQGGTNGTGGAGGAVIIQSVASGYAPVERLRILNNGAWSVGTDGVAYGTTGQVLTSNGNAVPTWSTVTSVGTLASLTVTGIITTAGLEVGTKIMPQNVQSIAYTTVLADSGAHVLHPSADTTARIYTIPANASVPYPIGTQLTFVNQDSAGVITIGITSDVMRLAGAGTTGDRTLAANGIATALKITGTEWIISGTGLS